jgi:hypothetical protein
VLLDLDGVGVWVTLERLALSAVCDGVHDDEGDMSVCVGSAVRRVTWTVIVGDGLRRVVEVLHLSSDTDADAEAVCVTALDNVADTLPVDLATAFEFVLELLEVDVKLVEYVHDDAMEEIESVVVVLSDNALGEGDAVALPSLALSVV